MTTVGSRLGPYEIVAPLGAGGMGEVFRARDTRIDRLVALKILPAAWASDPERLRRFEQEARSVGALTHPNLLTLYDVGTSGGVPFLVTELLEGDSLRDRLNDGSMPVRKAVDIACQIARGLAAAHEHGIVHRDIKPENVFITRDGRVKILDFGLARLASEETADEGADERTGLATRAGAVIGTPGYLSPEQARGLPVDARTDVFSLGAVLYEMLAGRRAFPGPTAVDAISAVVRDEPAELVNPALSPALVHVARRCLEKQPDERYQSARDVAFALEAVSSGSGMSTDRSTSAPSPARRWAFAAVAALAAALFTWLATTRLRPAAVPDGAVLRYETYSGLDSAPAISPDGRTMAFTSARDGMSRIWLKQFVGSSEAPITSGPDDYARFHPDGGSVLFIRHEGDRTAVFRQPLLGGDARRLISDADEADWSPDGSRIAIIRRARSEATVQSSILVAAADGTQLREIGVFRTVLTQPRFSPDGQFVASVEYGLQSGVARHLFIVKVADGSLRMLDTPLSKRRLSSPLWMADGRHMVYGVAESLTADTSGSAGRLYLQDTQTGDSRLLLWTPMNPIVVDAVSDGTLVWDGVSPRANLRLLQIGSARGTADRWITRGQSNDRQPVFSPDGEWIVFSSNRSGNLDLWALSRKTGAVRQLTDDAADDWDPGLTRDGHLIWSSTRTGNFEIWTANFDGSEARQLSHDEVDAENPTATPDGWIVYGSSNPNTQGIWKIRLDGTGGTRLSPASVLVPDVSPDGQYVAATTQSQTAQAKIQVWRVDDGTRVPFEISLATDQLTFAVGRVRWMPDGTHLAFLGLDDRGIRGVYVQDFVPGRDTTASRRPLGAFDADTRTESFAISPDGSELVVTGTDQLRTILRADGIAGVTRATPRK